MRYVVGFLIKAWSFNCVYFQAFAHLSDKLVPLLDGVIDNKNHWLHLAQVAQSKQVNNRDGSSRKVSFANSTTNTTLMITSSKADDQSEPNKTAHINNINNNNNSYSVTNHNGISMCPINKHSLDVDQRRSNQEILSDIDRLAGNKEDLEDDGRNTTKWTSTTPTSTTNTVQVSRSSRNNGTTTNTIDVRQRNGDLVTDKEFDQK